MIGELAHFDMLFYGPEKRAAQASTPRARGYMSAPTEFANLKAFFKWARAMPIASFRPPPGAIFDFEHEESMVRGVVLHRAGQYQLEMLTVRGPLQVGEHRHPNVESIEIILAGTMDICVEGEHRIPDALIGALDEDGRLVVAGWRTHIPRGALHGGSVGPTGGVILSFQRWVSGDPTSIGLDWVGPERVSVHV